MSAPEPLFALPHSFTLRINVNPIYHIGAKLPEFHRPLSVVAQVTAHLRELIELNTWQEDERLPSTKELANQLGVSIGTVHNGLRVLAKDGMLAAKRKRGTFVQPRSQWRTDGARLGDHIV